jgi:hypothetical protein
MKIVLFGASGMIGQGVLRECLADPGVTAVVSVGRRATGTAHPKLREVVHGDLGDLTAIEHEFDGVDACFDCLGVSSAGMREADYRRVTYDYALAAGRALVKHSPAAVLVFVTGAGTDSTGQGRSMWARVKGQTENALLALPFANVGESADGRKTGGAFMFRPAYIHAMHGIVSRTRLYRTLYIFTRPLFPILKWLLPNHVTTTENIGKAMLTIARRHGAPKRILESPDIERLAAG